MVLVFIAVNFTHFSFPWALVYHANHVPEWLLCAAISVFCIGEIYSKVE